MDPPEFSLYFFLGYPQQYPYYHALCKQKSAKSLLTSLYKREEFPLFDKEGLGEILRIVNSSHDTFRESKT
jgi:hypothetical protein